MNPEKQRIAIAEACGWRRRASTNKNFEFVWMHKDEGYCYALPDYLSDLNAMHEAEEEMERLGLCVEYVNTLRDFAIAPKTLSRYGLTHATAAQRAEAFLRAIGKWKES